MHQLHWPLSGSSAIHPVTEDPFLRKGKIRPLDSLSPGLIRLPMSDHFGPRVWAQRRARRDRLPAEFSWGIREQAFLYNDQQNAVEFVHCAVVIPKLCTAVSLAAKKAPVSPRNPGSGSGSVAAAFPTDNFGGRDVASAAIPASSPPRL